MKPPTRQEMAAALRWATEYLARPQSRQLAFQGVARTLIYLHLQQKEKSNAPRRIPD